MKKLKNMTKAELVLVARESGIDLPNGALKGEVLEAIEAHGGATVSSGNTETKEVKKPNVKKSDSPVSNGLVAVYAGRNLSWRNVGKLIAGYNFLSKEDADKWLQQKSVRLATPEEVAANFGV